MSAKQKKEDNKLKGTPGTVVYALASVVLGKPVAVKKYGSKNYNRTYLTGTVVRAFDARKVGGSNAVWKIEADWSVPGHEGEPQLYTCRRQDVHIRQPSSNPQVALDDFPDSINHRDAPTKGSTTYMSLSTRSPTKRSRIDEDDSSWDPEDAEQILEMTMDELANHVKSTKACASCGKETQEGLLNCSRCMCAVHMKCHDPPLLFTPQIFTCSNCLEKRASSTQVDKENVAQLERVATAARATSGNVIDAAPAAAEDVVGAARSEARNVACSALAAAVPLSSLRNQREVDVTKTPVFVETSRGTRHRVVSLNHGRSWVNTNSSTVFGDVSKPRPKMPWYFKGPFGEKIGPGNEKYSKMSRLDAWLISYPPKQLELSRVETLKKLQKIHPNDVFTTKEQVTFLGVCLLMTRTNYSGSRRNLWDGRQMYSKYINGQDFNKTGMGRNRFELIWTCYVWSVQPDVRPPEMTSAEYRWMLIRDHVDNFNRHRAVNFHPGGTLIVDETIIRWYGMGGEYVNVGAMAWVGNMSMSGSHIMSPSIGSPTMDSRSKIARMSSRA